MMKYVSNCIKSLESRNYDNTGLWKIIAPSTLTFGDVTVRKCYTCKMYIHPNRIFKHITSECKMYVSAKNLVACNCGNVLQQINYGKHLLTPSLINRVIYLENYHYYHVSTNK